MSGRTDDANIFSLIEILLSSGRDVRECGSETLQQVPFSLQVTVHDLIHVLTTPPITKHFSLPDHFLL